MRVCVCAVSAACTHVPSHAPEHMPPVRTADTLLTQKHSKAHEYARARRRLFRWNKRTSPRFAPALSALKHTNIQTPHTTRPVKNLKTRRTPPHHHHEVSSRGETAPFVPTTVPMERVTALSVLLIPSRPCPASSPQGRVEGDQFQIHVLVRLRLQPDPLLDDSSGSLYIQHGGCLGGGGRRETHTHYY